jgi:hypothetical protein
LEITFHRWAGGLSLVNIPSKEGSSQESPAFTHGEWSKKTKALFACDEQKVLFFIGMVTIKEDMV